MTKERYKAEKMPNGRWVVYNTATMEPEHTYDTEEMAIDAAREFNEDITIKAVAHTDSRLMQALPWKVKREDLSSDLLSANGKHIATFWGNDERHPQNLLWCTQEQRHRHAAYTEHACNAFPMMQLALEGIYGLEDMPEDAIKIIEEVMRKCYREEVPIYVNKK